MNAKKTRGLTLVELLVSLAILIIIVGMTGLAVFEGFKYYAEIKKMQDEEYNIRMAALSISRDIRRGVEIIEPADGEGEKDTLKFTMINGDGALIIYTIETKNENRKLTYNGDVIVDLETFSVKRNRNHVTFKLTGEHGLEVSMTVAIKRYVYE